MANLLDIIITEYRNIYKTIKLVQPTIIENPIVRLTNEPQYFPSNIKTYIINHTTHLIIYKYNEHTIYFYTYDLKVNITELNNYYKKIIAMLTMLKKYTTISCTTINAKIYLTPFKKELSNTKILNISHVNSGLTSLCRYTNEIIVYRKEEWFKVFIHECFHYYGLDFAYMPKEIYKQKLSNIFCISSEYLLYESYTECMAELIYLCIYSIDHNLNINEMLRNELKHSLYQTNKILKHIGCRYQDLLCENNKRNTKMIENTNVFCYYILKTLYFFYLPDFLKWCSIHNDTLLSFNKTNNTVLSFCDWIQQHYKRDEFMNSIATISLKYKSEISNKSLRMNIYSYGL